MAHKENKGGVLTNEQIEQDLQVKGKELHQGHYQGSQDTGDNKMSANTAKEKTNDEVKKPQDDLE